MTDWQQSEDTTALIKGLDSSVSGVAVCNLHMLDHHLLVLQEDLLTIKRKQEKCLYRLAMGGGASL